MTFGRLRIYSQYFVPHVVFSPHHCCPPLLSLHSFFLLLAAILRRRHDLLAVSGTPLRRLLSAILSPEGIARAGLQGKRAETAEMDNDDGGAVADDDHGKEGSSDGERSALMLWCKEAEALDLNTPESFRHHLALIWEIAEAEHEVGFRLRFLGVDIMLGCARLY